MDKKKYICPICNSSELVLRHEASYVYSYVIDTDKPGYKNKEEFLPYKYDKREQMENCEYVECDRCKTKYPYEFLNGVLSKETWV